MFKRFINDFRKYSPYAIRAGKSELKSEVASSHLSWLWWVLDPLLFMLVYSFVSIIVFGKSEQYFSAFIFVGYTSFKFFERMLKNSVKLVASNKAIVKNVYIPKIMLIFTKLYVNLFEFAISFGLVFVTMLLYRVPITWRVVYFLPLVLLLVMLSLGFGSILMHFGVYVEDLSNVINITLRLLFYMSGVFYNINKRIDNDYLRVLLMKVNPMAFVIQEMRESLLYGGQFDYVTYAIWFVVSLLLFYIGTSVIYKNENGYVKVM